MQFAHDTEVALGFVTALVNTAVDGDESLPDTAALAAFLDEHRVSGTRAGTAAELEAVRALRARLAAVWDAAETAETAEVVDVVNQLLREAHALPRLVDHDGWGWHLHLTPFDAPLVDRLGTEAAMAFADLIRSDELSRLRRCAADDCTAAYVDLSRNRSKRYCDTGNCANRMHVAAYRERQARRRVGSRVRTSPGPGGSSPDAP